MAGSLFEGFKSQASTAIFFELEVSATKSSHSAPQNPLLQRNRTLETLERVNGRPPMPAPRMLESQRCSYASFNFWNGLRLTAAL
jgi:hypothetical protein